MSENNPVGQAQSPVLWDRRFNMGEGVKPDDPVLAIPENLKQRYQIYRPYLSQDVLTYLDATFARGELKAYELDHLQAYLNTLELRIQILSDQDASISQAPQGALVFYHSADLFDRVLPTGVPHAWGWMAQMEILLQRGYLSSLAACDLLRLAAADGGEKLPEMIAYETGTGNFTYHASSSSFPPSAEVLGSWAQSLIETHPVISSNAFLKIRLLLVLSEMLLAGVQDGTLLAEDYSDLLQSWQAQLPVGETPQAQAAYAPYRAQFEFTLQYLQYCAGTLPEAQFLKVAQAVQQSAQAQTPPQRLLGQRAALAVLEIQNRGKAPLAQLVAWNALLQSCEGVYTLPLLYARETQCAQLVQEQLAVSGLYDNNGDGWISAAEESDDSGYRSAYDIHPNQLQTAGRDAQVSGAQASVYKRAISVAEYLQVALAREAHQSAKKYVVYLPLEGTTFTQGALSESRQLQVDESRALTTEVMTRWMPATGLLPEVVLAAEAMTFEKRAALLKIFDGRDLNLKADRQAVSAALRECMAASTDQTYSALDADALLMVRDYLSKAQAVAADAGAYTPTQVKAIAAVCDAEALQILLRPIGVVHLDHFRSDPLEAWNAKDRRALQKDIDALHRALRQVPQNRAAAYMLAYLYENALKDPQAALGMYRHLLWAANTPDTVGLMDDEQTLERLRLLAETKTQSLPLAIAAQTAEAAQNGMLQNTARLRYRQAGVEAMHAQAINVAVGRASALEAEYQYGLSVFLDRARQTQLGVTAVGGTYRAGLGLDFDWQLASHTTLGFGAGAFFQTLNSNDSALFHGFLGADFSHRFYGDNPYTLTGQVKPFQGAQFEARAGYDVLTGQPEGVLQISQSWIPSVIFDHPEHFFLAQMRVGVELSAADQFTLATLAQALNPVQFGIHGDSRLWSGMQMYYDARLAFWGSYASALLATDPGVGLQFGLGGMAWLPSLTSPLSIGASPYLALGIKDFMQADQIHLGLFYFGLQHSSHMPGAANYRYGFTLPLGFFADTYVNPGETAPDGRYGAYPDLQHPDYAVINLQNGGVEFSHVDEAYSVQRGTSKELSKTDWQLVYQGWTKTKDLDAKVAAKKWGAYDPTHAAIRTDLYLQVDAASGQIQFRYLQGGVPVTLDALDATQRAVVQTRMAQLTQEYLTALTQQAAQALQSKDERLAFEYLQQAVILSQDDPVQVENLVGLLESWLGRDTLPLDAAVVVREISRLQNRLRGEHSALAGKVASIYIAYAQKYPDLFKDARLADAWVAAAPVDGHAVRGFDVIAMAEIKGAGAQKRQRLQAFIQPQHPEVARLGQELAAAIQAQYGDALTSEQLALSILKYLTLVTEYHQDGPAEGGFVEPSALATVLLGSAQYDPAAVLQGQLPQQRLLADCDLANSFVSLYQAALPEAFPQLSPAAVDELAAQTRVAMLLSDSGADLEDTRDDTYHAAALWDSGGQLYALDVPPADIKLREDYGLASDFKQLDARVDAAGASLKLNGDRLLLTYDAKGIQLGNPRFQCAPYATLDAATGRLIFGTFDLQGTFRRVASSLKISDVYEQMYWLRRSILDEGLYDSVTIGYSDAAGRVHDIVFSSDENNPDTLTMRETVSEAGENDLYELYAYDASATWVALSSAAGTDYAVTEDETTTYVNTSGNEVTLGYDNSLWSGETLSSDDVSSGAFTAYAYLTGQESSQTQTYAYNVTTGAIELVAESTGENTVDYQNSVATEDSNVAAPLYREISFTEDEAGHGSFSVWSTEDHDSTGTTVTYNEDGTYNYTMHTEGGTTELILGADDEVTDLQVTETGTTVLVMSSDGTRSVTVNIAGQAVGASQLSGLIIDTQSYHADTTITIESSSDSEVLVDNATEEESSLYSDESSTTTTVTIETGGETVEKNLTLSNAFTGTTITIEGTEDLAYTTDVNDVTIEDTIGSEGTHTLESSGSSVTTYAGSGTTQQTTTIDFSGALGQVAGLVLDISAYDVSNGYIYVTYDSSEDLNGSTSNSTTVYGYTYNGTGTNETSIVISGSVYNNDRIEIEGNGTYTYTTYTDDPNTEAVEEGLSTEVVVTDGDQATITRSDDLTTVTFMNYQADTTTTYFIDRANPLGQTTTGIQVSNRHEEGNSTITVTSSVDEQQVVSVDGLWDAVFADPELQSALEAYLEDGQALDDLTLEELALLVAEAIADGAIDDSSFIETYTYDASTETWVVTDSTVTENNSYTVEIVNPITGGTLLVSEVSDITYDLHSESYEKVETDASDSETPDASESSLSSTRAYTSDTTGTFSSDTTRFTIYDQHQVLLYGMTIDQSSQSYEVWKGSGDILISTQTEETESSYTSTSSTETSSDDTLQEGASVTETITRGGNPVQTNDHTVNTVTSYSEKTAGTEHTEAFTVTGNDNGVETVVSGYNSEIHLSSAVTESSVTDTDYIDAGGAHVTGSTIELYYGEENQSLQIAYVQRTGPGGQLEVSSTEMVITRLLNGVYQSSFTIDNPEEGMQITVNENGTMDVYLQVNGETAALTLYDAEGNGAMLQVDNQVVLMAGHYQIHEGQRRVEYDDGAWELRHYSGDSYVLMQSESSTTSQGTSERVASDVEEGVYEQQFTGGSVANTSTATTLSASQITYDGQGVSHEGIAYVIAGETLTYSESTLNYNDQVALEDVNQALADGDILALQNEQVTVVLGRSMTVRPGAAAYATVFSQTSTARDGSTESGPRDIFVQRVSADVTRSLDFKASHTVATVLRSPEQADVQALRAFLGGSEGPRNPRLPGYAYRTTAIAAFEAAVASGLDAEERMAKLKAAIEVFGQLGYYDRARVLAYYRDWQVRGVTEDAETLRLAEVYLIHPACSMHADSARMGIENLLGTLQDPSAKQVLQYLYDYENYLLTVGHYDESYQHEVKRYLALLYVAADGVTPALRRDLGLVLEAISWLYMTDPKLRALSDYVTSAYAADSKKAAPSGTTYRTQTHGQQSQGDYYYDFSWGAELQKIYDQTQQSVNAVAGTVDNNAAAVAATHAQIAPVISTGVLPAVQSDDTTIISPEGFDVSQPQTPNVDVAEETYQPTQHYDESLDDAYIHPQERELGQEAEADLGPVTLLWGLDLKESNTGDKVAYTAGAESDFVEVHVTVPVEQWQLPALQFVAVSSTSALTQHLSAADAAGNAFDWTQVTDTDVFDVYMLTYDVQESDSYQADLTLKVPLGSSVYWVTRADANTFDPYYLRGLVEANTEVLYEGLRTGVSVQASVAVFEDGTVSQGGGLGGLYRFSQQWALTGGASLRRDSAQLELGERDGIQSDQLGVNTYGAVLGLESSYDTGVFADEVHSFEVSAEHLAYDDGFTDDRLRVGFSYSGPVQRQSWVKNLPLIGLFAVHAGQATEQGHALALRDKRDVYDAFVSDVSLWFPDYLLPAVEVFPMESVTQLKTEHEQLKKALQHYQYHKAIGCFKRLYAQAPNDAVRLFYYQMALELQDQLPEAAAAQMQRRFLAPYFAEKLATPAGDMDALLTELLDEVLAHFSAREQLGFLTRYAQQHPEVDVSARIQKATAQMLDERHTYQQFIGQLAGQPYAVQQTMVENFLQTHPMFSYAKQLKKHEAFLFKQYLTDADTLIEKQCRSLQLAWIHDDQAAFLTQKQALLAQAAGLPTEQRETLEQYVYGFQ